MQEPWPSVGFADLGRDARGWLVPGAAWWARQVARPELALVEESCAAERALHASLSADPVRPVAEAELARLADADARDNWRTFLHWRDRVLAAGSLEAAYVSLFGRGTVDVAPVFVDTMAAAIVRGLLEASDDALEWRAAEMLFRPQRCTTNTATTGGRLVAGDRDTLDQLNRHAGLGELGRLLAEAGTAMRKLELEVLTPDLGPAYFAQAERRRFLLDLTTELERDLGHGVQFRLANARSAQKGLARVIERWVAHLLGVAVRVQPLARIEDADWRWHLGLDASATEILNDLYAGREVEAERQRRIVALFRLDFDDPAAVRPELAGTPVWLGAAMDADGVLRLKPQNLLVNLPLAARS